MRFFNHLGFLGAVDENLTWWHCLSDYCLLFLGKRHWAWGHFPLRQVLYLKESSENHASAKPCLWLFVQKLMLPWTNEVRSCDQRL